MKLIITQRIDHTTGENVGGLYINLDCVASIYHDREKAPTGCHIVMNNGIHYRVAHSVSEILDVIIQQNQRTLAEQIRTQCLAYDLRTTYHHISDLLAKLPE